MSDKKIISINPELLSFSNFSAGKTQKKRQPVEKELKIRSPAEPRKASTKTLRNKLLQYIRKTQEENYRKMHSGESPEITTRVAPVKPPPFTGNNTFEDSIAFMNNIQEQVKNSVAPTREPAVHTLKNYESLSSPSLSPVYNTVSDQVSDYTTNVGIPNQSLPAMKMKSPDQPQWGCLRGGSLPTYRSWKTQKYRPMMENTSVAMINGAIAPSTTPNPLFQGGSQNQSIINVDPFPEKTIMHKTREKIASEQKKPTMHYKKQKKTIKRTYRVGKSKYAPKVSVLVSNKTIRNTISEKTHAIQQIPIEDIRRSLLKQGFIRVGTTAPNDVLRKMYESVSLICGEVQNHNPDNLLYNFLNGAPV
jgi:hypothetical protein